MPLFTSKIAAGILAGGFTLGAAGLLFVGADKLEDASNYVKETTLELIQFEENENTLLEKISALKKNANEIVNAKNIKIGELEGDKAQLESDKLALEGQIDGLDAEIIGLEADIKKLQGDLAVETTNHAATKKALDEKTAAYNAKVNELASMKAQRDNLQNLLNYAQAKATEADKLVTELEGEVQKANAAVKKHTDIVAAEKAKAAVAEPTAKGKIDAISTTVGDKGVAPVGPVNGGPGTVTETPNTPIDPVE